MLPIQCFIVGDSGVGTGSLQSRLSQYEQFEFSKLYMGIDLFLLCFALDNANSFENVKSKWYPEIRKHCPKTSRIILVGTKLDLREQFIRKFRINEDLKNFIMKLAVVTHQQGEVLAKKIGAVNYLECNAVDETSVETFATQIIRTVKATFPLEKLLYPYVGSSKKPT